MTAAGTGGVDLPVAGDGRAGGVRLAGRSGSGYTPRYGSVNPGGEGLRKSA